MSGSIFCRAWISKSAIRRKRNPKRKKSGAILPRSLFKGGLMSASHKGVRGGTPHGKPLCRSCINAHYRKGGSQTQLTLICSATHDEREMQFEAIRCNDYYDVKRSYLYDMEKIAWIIVPKSGGRVGFEPPKKEDE
jgi:hypothetical protein